MSPACHLANRQFGISLYTPTGLQILFPELKKLLWQAYKGFRPPRLELVYRAATVGATADEDFRKTVVYRLIDDRRRAAKPLVRVQSRHDLEGSCRREKLIANLIKPYRSHQR